MDIPFIRKGNSRNWIIAGVAGVIAASAIFYRYFTDRSFKFWNKNANLNSAENTEHEMQSNVQDQVFKSKKKKAPKNLAANVNPHHKE
jgi:hypothetical protein